MFISELRHRDPLLFWIGGGMLLTLVVVTLISISDQRLILGINPWIKPMKFLTSITLFLWTVAWFMPETRGPDPAASGVGRIDKRKVVRWTIGSAMIVEIACIILQSARGASSHFNNDTPFDAAIFGIMGATILINTLAMVLFFAIIRTDAPPQRAGYIWGIRLGVLIFLLASAEGAIIVGNNAHTVGAVDGGPGLPFVNWSTQHGDLRVAHFFGLHALQLLPLIGFLFGSRNLVVATSIIWVAVMGGLLLMALRGQPLLAL
jgi:hypothetical protein